MFSNGCSYVMFIEFVKTTIFCSRRKRDFSIP